MKVPCHLESLRLRQVLKQQCQIQCHLNMTTCCSYAANHNVDYSEREFSVYHFPFMIQAGCLTGYFTLLQHRKQTGKLCCCFQPISLPCLQALAGLCEMWKVNVAGICFKKNASFISMSKQITTMFPLALGFKNLKR